MTTLKTFLKTGKLSNIACQSSRGDVVKFTGPGFKTWNDEYEELLHFHAFGAFLFRGPAKGLEDGKLSGFGFFFAYNEIVPEHLAFPDFELTPSTQAIALNQFMAQNEIQFEGESHFTVTEGGVALLHQTPKLTSLIFPCPATGYWKRFIEGEPAMEKLLRRCHQM